MVGSTFTCLYVRNNGAILVSERLDDATNTKNVKKWFDIYLVNSRENGDHYDQNGEKH